KIKSLEISPHFYESQKCGRICSHFSSLMTCYGKLNSIYP
ncbi:2-amino-4-hydroxy-6- hydroxymethyldihydropteridine pyrophosphokinase, partial [Haemophilus influenzae]